jgi:hypothetical protein
MTDTKDLMRFYGEHYLEMSPQCPLVIPSYKNRPDSRIHELDKLSDNKIFVFVYDWDYEASGYDKCQYKNVEYVKIPPVPWRCIQRKRYWISNYMIEHHPEIDHYIMMDDDITDGGKMANFTDTRGKGHKTISKIPLRNMLGMLDHLHTNYSHHTVSAFPIVNLSIGGSDIFSSSTQRGYQAFCIQNNIQPWRDKTFCSEDNLIWYDLQKQGKKYDVYMNFQIPMNLAIETTTSTLFTQAKNFIETARIMKFDCKITKSYSKGWEFQINFNTKKPYEEFFGIKDIFDKYLPDWTNLDKEFTDEQYEQVRTALKKLLNNN